MRPYRVVGHRGFPQQFPENSLAGFVAAAERGADCIELDVQVSQGGQLMVFHDECLDRVTEHRGWVWDYTAAQLMAISAHEPERFAGRFSPTPIATLREVCEALSRFDVYVFIEVKEACLALLSEKTLLEKLVSDAASLTKYAIISFNRDILEVAKGRAPTGWVLKVLNEEVLVQAQALAPEFLITDVKGLKPDHRFWPGQWQWFLYDITDPEIAAFWADKGVGYIETWDVGAFCHASD